MAELTEKISSESPADRPEKARSSWRNSTIRKPVRAALGEMAAGFETCMYCGESRGTDVDHFEPIVRNPLRTFDWLNHLLACSACNSHQKRDQFPLDQDGTPLLIDPTAEDPFNHLLLTLSLGIYSPLTLKGEVTIEVCGLNRRGLPQGRMHARNVVELALHAWDRARGRDRSDEMRKHVRTVQGQPFADVCQSMLRQALSPGADIVFSDSPDLLELLRSPDLRQALLR
ncbi:HNH endonuclease [Lentzea sp.]|uniref:HNH endonuclease n=1 Tax=Lentzea sp. TaxID=56099 RepID=UPI002CF8EDF7|nr:HNH endonuclease [Lentzea sp.]HUQ57102.1 HNH endonuclease [Lentzea sp.]